MPPSHHQPTPQKTGASGRGGHRYVLSARAQAVLTWILEDIIEKTLKDASRMAEAAGKQRVELVEVEGALKRLCERYHARWSAEGNKSRRAGSEQSKRKHPSKKF